MLDDYNSYLCEVSALFCGIAAALVRVLTYVMVYYFCNQSQGFFGGEGERGHLPLP